MTTYKKIAVLAAKEAGLVLKRNLGQKRKIGYKGVVNLVTEMDLYAEKIITSYIKKHFPKHNILAEEEMNLEGDSSFRWIIDPLDGTTNYAHGYPIFCISIALQKGEKIILGVVYDPMRDELFLAEEGKGAKLNGQRIQVSSTPKLSQALLATGFPYDLRESDKNNFDHFRNFGLRVQAVRRAGSAALDLCYVAAGRFDGFWEMKLGPWDFAAGSLIVKEAGGKVTDFNGQPLSLFSPHVLASNGKIHKEMMAIIKMGKY